MNNSFNSALVVPLGSASDEFDNVVEVNKKLLLNKPRKHSKEKRLPTRRLNRLKILSHQ